MLRLIVVMWALGLVPAYGETLPEITRDEAEVLAVLVGNGARVGEEATASTCSRLNRAGKCENRTAIPEARISRIPGRQVRFEANGSSGLQFRFSRVAFDRARKRALVVVDTIANLSGTEDEVSLEKRAGEWIVVRKRVLSDG